MVLVAITSLQISHTIRGHAVEDKVIKIVTGDSNKVQNLEADGIKICDWARLSDEINSEYIFFELSRGDGYFDALIEIKIGVRNILEDALGVDLYDEFDHINMDKES
ncbi:hypothetical protein MKW92_023727 [Papaver armeniacum]|nr:hypothetical protein MKW92_023727 [Papaver armeniacum]